MEYSKFQKTEINLVEGKNWNIPYSNESKKNLLQEKMEYSNQNKIKLVLPQKWNISCTKGRLKYNNCSNFVFSRKFLD